MSAFSLLISPITAHALSSLSYRTFCYPNITFICPLWANECDISRRFGEYLKLRYIFGAFKHRPVSYYAFIIRWLLPSLLPGCLSLKTSFTTKILLWNLSVRSGLFPSRLWTLAPKVCLYILKKRYLEFPWIQ
jgi:hypothetical protein